MVEKFEEDESINNASDSSSSSFSQVFKKNIL